jgi:16S rRNA (cytosine1402-N4)-methyltransferase
VHVPALLDAVVEAIVAEPGVEASGVVVDATVGAGGHAERILEAIGPAGRLLGIDRDEEALLLARRRLDRFGRRARLVRGEFGDLEEIVRREGWEAVDGVLWDLGISSMHVDRPERGFSFRHDAPLDMRMDRSSGPTAADILNTYPESDLTRVLRTYGEERWASRIAKFIVRERQRRPLSTTLELVEIIRAAVPSAARRAGPHPARRTFQALRIEVNKELQQLESSLPQAVAVTRKGGRLVAVSYHSLEDRVVKRFFASESGGPAPRLRLVTRKSHRPDADEIAANPRASSARMRAAERVGSADGSIGGETPRSPEGAPRVARLRAPEPPRRPEGSAA